MDQHEQEQHTQPQFPAGLEGELARALIGQSLDAAQRREIYTLLRELREAQTHQSEIVAGVVRATLEAVLGRLPTTPTQPDGQAPPSDTPRRHHWDISEWNAGYPGFRADVLRRWNDNGGGGIGVLAGLCGLTERHFLRARQYFHVEHLWPPTTWPEQEPLPSKPPRSLRTGGPGALAAASFVAYGCLAHAPLNHTLSHVLQVVSGLSQLS